MNDTLPIANTLNFGDLFIRKIKIMSWIALVIAGAYQIIMFNEISNLMAVGAITVTWFLSSNILLRRALLETHLLSTFIILGFVLSQFYFPLLLTSFEGKPVIYNLEMPEEVFLHAGLCLLALLVAHGVYIFLRRFSFDRSTSLIERAGFFTPPTHLQVWIIGFLGMAASLYVYIVQPDVGREVTGAAQNKLLQGLVPFSYAPFFIPLSRLYGNKSKMHKGFVPMLIAYSLILLVVSMARNSRGAFILGLTSPVFAYGIGLMLGVFKTKIFTIKNIVVIGMIGWLLVGPLADLGTAMLLVRGTRSEIPPGELISQTIETLSDKRAIEARKLDDVESSAIFDWDERYLDNLYTARFASIKINDMNLITSTKIGVYDEDMLDYSIDYLWSSLPDPILKFFKIDVDKEEVMSMSFGDFMYVLSGGYGFPKAFRLGHISGSGMATFGWWYLMILGIVMIPTFYLVDKLFRRKKFAPGVEVEAPEDKFKFSFASMLALTMLFQFLLTESVVQIVIYYFRGWLQMMVLYFLMFHISRFIGNAINFSQKRKTQLAV